MFSSLNVYFIFTLRKSWILTLVKVVNERNRWFPNDRFIVYDALSVLDGSFLVAALMFLDRSIKYLSIYFILIFNLRFKFFSSYKYVTILFLVPVSRLILWVSIVYFFLIPPTIIMILWMMWDLLIKWLLWCHILLMWHWC